MFLCNYYARLKEKGVFEGEELVVSVPGGNFGFKTSKVSSESKREVLFMINDLFFFFFGFFGNLLNNISIHVNGLKGCLHSKFSYRHHLLSCRLTSAGIEFPERSGGKLQ
jgi:hypothetical protein